MLEFTAKQKKQSMVNRENKYMANNFPKLIAYILKRLKKLNNSVLRTEKSVCCKFVNTNLSSVSLFI